MALLTKKKKDRGLYTVLQKDINKIVISYTLVAVPLVGLVGLMLSPIYKEFRESKAYAIENRQTIESDLKQIANLTTQLSDKSNQLSKKKTKLQESGISRELTTSVDNYIRYLDVKATEFGLKLETTDIIVTTPDSNSQANPLLPQDQSTNSSDTIIDGTEVTDTTPVKLIRCTVRGIYSNISLFLSSLNTKQVIYLVDLQITEEPLTDYSIADIVLSLTPPQGANLNILDTPTDNLQSNENNTQNEGSNENLNGETNNTTQGTGSTQGAGTTQGNGTNQESEIDSLYGGDN